MVEGQPRRPQIWMLTGLGRVTATRKLSRKLAFVEISTGGENSSIGTPSQVMFNLSQLELKNGPVGDDALKESMLKLQRGDWIGLHSRTILFEKTC